MRMIAEGIFENNNNYGAELFRKLIDIVLKHSEFVDTSNRIWLKLDIKVLEYYAHTDIETYLEVIQKLFQLWSRNTYICDLGVLFGSYKSIGDNDERKKAKLILRKYYEEMIKLNPNIRDLKIEFL